MIQEWLISSSSRNPPTITASELIVCNSINAPAPSVEAKLNYSLKRRGESKKSQEMIAADKREPRKTGI